MSTHLTNAARDAVTDALLAEEAHLRSMLDRLREHGLDDGAVLVLPEDMAPGVTQVFGLPVVRAAVPHPLIGLPATRTTA
ncbi:hypothetical protein ACQEU3_46890 [Spirillospora sp. CA-253888]